MSNKGLGKGLDALISTLSVNEDDNIVEIPLTQLRPNPFQPRKTFKDEAINELASSIKEHGVLQPIIVRSVLKGHEIIAGERRWRAAQACNLATIPAVVRNFNDQQVTEIALIENIQREDLNSLEIAQAYQLMMDQFSLTQEELSTKVGKSRSHVANFLRLLQLPDEIKHHVSRGTISMGHARALAGVSDSATKTKLTNLIIRNRWSVRELEEAIQNMSTKKQKTKKKAAKTEEKQDPFIHSIEHELRNKFQTAVKVKHQNTKGVIEFSYYSQDDLERLLEILQISVD
ncbi:ParB/RepB/Spo0J family partition protein [Longirhabdus pacifica]|uniref:ParB/RepB/Spo0J family partition protein n=1 Tax=Longirhabdus pacifica TaxID=2305227 RepID=UPI001008F76E|nr:ParB/RepB/Spo0J family partition protein [Longirhabdus pacifica]